MMDFVKVNLNDHIKFKINDLGLKRLSENYHNIMGAHGCAKWPFKQPDLDSDGYCTMQIHEFLEQFGGQYLSNVNNPFKSMNVLIEAEEPLSPSGGQNSGGESDS